MLQWDYSLDRPTFINRESKFLVRKPTFGQEVFFIGKESAFLLGRGIT